MIANHLFPHPPTQIYPYHLAHYVARVLRVTPADYYADLLASALAARAPYASLPNFAAADAAAVLGIGRNEFIAASNDAASSRRGPFKPSRSALRELVAARGGLLAPPRALAPWWRVHAVNVTDTEFRSLTVGEVGVARAAAAPGGAAVGDLPPDIVASLYARGLLYFSLPLHPGDAVTVTSLEGFVSNRDGGRAASRPHTPASARGGAPAPAAGGGTTTAPPSTASSPDADPLEAALYAVLLAAGPATRLDALGDLLGIEGGRVAAAVGVAARLGFATIVPADSGGASSALEADAGASAGDAAASSPPPPPSTPPPRGVALVVDAAVASLLMVGALAPGLQRHAVTLFEGGRVAGAANLADLVQQLDASTAAAASFEGDAASLGDGAAALAVALRCLQAGVAAAARERDENENGDLPSSVSSVELLRRESLAGLAPAAAARLLAHSYSAVVVGAPCAPPPLPAAVVDGEGGGGGGASGARSSSRPPPVLYGPTGAAATPWGHVALWTAAGTGPPGAVVLSAGTLLRALPRPLARARGVLVAQWPPKAGAAPPRPAAASRPLPSALGAAHVPAPFVLAALNEALARGAVLAVPLGGGGGVDDGAPPQLTAIDVPLPLPSPVPATLTGVDIDTGADVEVASPPGLGCAAGALGLATTLGALRFVSLPSSAAPTPPTLYGLTLGLPLAPLPVTRAVCTAATGAAFLTPAALAAGAAGAARARATLSALVAAHGAVADSGDADAVPGPAHALVFDGEVLGRLGGSVWRHGGASGAEVE